MKLCNETLTVLKNFAAINQNLELKKGHVIRTIEPQKRVLAKAKVKDSFPQDLCIYDLNEFLSVYAIDKDTELDFDEHNVIFKNGRSKIKYRKSAKEAIVVPPEKDLSIPSVDFSFTLTESTLASLVKSAGVLSTPHISVKSDGTSVTLMCFDGDNDSKNTREIEIDETTDKTFNVVFSVDNLKIIPETYNVDICFKGIAHFSSVNQEIEYWIATEAKYSKYE